MPRKTPSNAKATTEFPAQNRAGTAASHARAADFPEDLRRDAALPARVEVEGITGAGSVLQLSEPPPPRRRGRPSKAESQPNLRTPSYRHHKASGQALVTIAGRDHYLGPFGSKESHARYTRLIGQWMQLGCPRAMEEGQPEPDGYLIIDMLDDYRRHVTRHYSGPDGKVRRHVKNIAPIMRDLRIHFGTTPAAEFTPRLLKELRQVWIARHLTRVTCNNAVNAVRQAFKWAVEEDRVPVTVFQALKAVEPLKRGRDGAREGEPVKPVPDEHVDAIRDDVAPEVWAMVELQRLTGMRSGEVVLMRAADINMQGDHWEYTPSAHKSDRFGHRRVVCLGRQAQTIIRPFLTTNPIAFLFSPQRVMERRRAERAEERRTPESCGNARGTNIRPAPRVVKPSSIDDATWAAMSATEREATMSELRRAKQHKPATRYSPVSYARAITRAIERVNQRREEEAAKRGVVAVELPRWHPHRLRHSFATLIRRKFGVELARVMCGHRSVDTTEIYAERDMSAAARIALEVG